MTDRYHPNDGSNEARKARQEKQQAKAQRQMDALKKAFDTVAGTPEGLLVLRHIMGACLWKAPLLGFSAQDGVISRENTEYNVARRDVWRDIRRLLPWQSINSVEMELEPDVDQDDEDES